MAIAWLYKARGDSEADEGEGATPCETFLEIQAGVFDRTRIVIKRHAI
jgi:hypothetical protein